MSSPAEPAADRQERLHALEPYAFFTAVVLGVIVALAAIAWQAMQPVGPATAQAVPAAAVHH